MPETSTDMTLSRIVIRDHKIVANMIKNLQFGYHQFEQIINNHRVNELEARYDIAHQVGAQNKHLRLQWLKAMGFNDETKLMQNDDYKHETNMQSSWMFYLLDIVNPMVVNDNIIETRKIVEQLSLDDNPDDILDKPLRYYLDSAYTTEEFIAELGRNHKL